MSITVAQASSKQHGTIVTTTTYNFTGVAAGSTLIVPIISYRNPFATFVVTDGDGTYLKDVSATVTGGQIGVHIFRLINASAGTHAIVITSDGATTYYTYAVLEIATEILLEHIMSSTGSSATPTTGATRSTAAVEKLIVAAMVFNANLTSLVVESTSPAWTQLFEHLAFSGQNCGEADYKIDSAGGAFTGNWTANASNTWAAAIATYKEAVSSGGGGGPIGEDNHIFM